MSRVQNAISIRKEKELSRMDTTGNVSAPDATAGKNEPARRLTEAMDCAMCGGEMGILPGCERCRFCRFRARIIGEK